MLKGKQPYTLEMSFQVFSAIRCFLGGNSQHSLPTSDMTEWIFIIPMYLRVGYIQNFKTLFIPDEDITSNLLTK